MAKIAFIGLGNMGSGMAANLVKAGHEVLAFDLSADAVAHAVNSGASAAASAGDAVAAAEAVVTMLPAGKHVRAVYEGEIFGAAAPGSLFMDCSTIDVASARHVGGLAVEKGFRFVDAPVSGGVAAAQGGTLTFMVGGSEADFAAAEVFLDAMGKAVLRAGDLGAGQAAKICNNMLLAISMIGTAEAMKMAERLGLDPQKFYEISSQSSGYCWSLNAYTPMPGIGVESPADKDYQGGFATGLMLKDLRLAMEAAETADASTPLGRHAKELYERFAEENAGLDFSAIIKTL